jgi:hypothetical protein
MSMLPTLGHATSQKNRVLFHKIDIHVANARNADDGAKTNFCSAKILRRKIAELDRSPESRIFFRENIFFSFFCKN